MRKVPCPSRVFEPNLSRVILLVALVAVPLLNVLPLSLGSHGQSRFERDDRGLFLGDRPTGALLNVVIPAQAGIHVDPRFRGGDGRRSFRGGDGKWNPRSIPLEAGWRIARGYNSQASGAQQARRETGAQAHLDRAKRMLASDDFPGARAELERALKANPGLADAYLNLGMVEYHLGDTAKAIPHLHRATELLPESFEAHYGLALAYLRARNTGEGIRELERARQINPRHPDAAYNLGIVLLGQGKAEEAARLFSETRQLKPDRPDVSFYVVYAALENRRFEEAEREANERAKVFGKDFQWRSGVGRLFLEHGRARDALPHLEEAVSLQPDSTEMRRLLAAARIELHNPAGALEALQNPQTAEDHYLRASALYLLRKYPEAQREAQQALQAEPRQAKYLLLAAQLAQRAGKHQDALDLLAQAVAAAPEWPEPYYSQGVSYYLQRRYEDARQSLRRAMDLDPQSSRALFVYAATLVNQGKNKEGEGYIQRALALDPSNARFRYHLGALLLRDNRPAEAQEAFEEAVRLKSDFAPPHYQLGKLLVRENHPGPAVDELETAIGLQPDLAQAYYQLSRAYTMLGQNDKASNALTSFNQLKKQQTDDDQEFLEGLRKDLEAP